MAERYSLCGQLPDFAPIARESIGGVAPERTVRITELDADKKRRLWAWMKANDAGAADVLQCEDVQRLLQAFPGSSPVVDIDYLRKAVG